MQDTASQGQPGEPLLVENTIRDVIAESERRWRDRNPSAGFGITIESIRRLSLLRRVHVHLCVTSQVCAPFYDVLSIDYEASIREVTDEIYDAMGRVVEQMPKT